jgi:hypothetical protein
MSGIDGLVRWQCRNCDREFDTRGQRDYHQRKTHQNVVTTHDQNEQRGRIQRSTSNAFDCQCGKKFQYAQGLHRHTKSCNGTLLMNEETHEDEGTIT